VLIVASPPPDVPPRHLSREEDLLLLALKTGVLDGLDFLPYQWTSLLLMVCNTPEFISDPVIRANLGRILCDPEKSVAREALFRALIANDSPPLRDLAVEIAVAPENLRSRALFFFLTGQWERYEALDFSRRMLRAAYTTEKAPVRRRILDKLRAAGHSEFLTAVIGQDFSRSVATMPSEELELVIAMLRSARDWNRLWELFFKTALSWSGRILAILVDAGWQPPEPERALFAELQTLFGEGLPLGPAALSAAIPRALLQVRLRSPGRINDVAFAPSIRGWPWLRGRAR